MIPSPYKTRFPLPLPDGGEPISASMRDPLEGAQAARVLQMVHGHYPPRPVCSPCSKAYRLEHDLPGLVLVDCALIVRDVASGEYRAIVHCHGEHGVIVLRPDPDELAVSSAVAFKPRG